MESILYPLLMGLILYGVMWQEAMSASSVYEDTEGQRLVVSVVYGSRVSLTCSGSRAGRFWWRTNEVASISAMHTQDSIGVWSSTISFDAVEENGNGSAECLTENSEAANSTVLKAFILQIQDRVAPTNFQVIQLNHSALHLTWDSLPSYTFTDLNASVFIDPSIDGYYLWMSTGHDSLDKWIPTELERNDYIYVTPQGLDHCSVLKFQVGAILRFTKEVTRSAILRACLARVQNGFSEKDVEVYIKDRMLYITIQVNTSCHCSFPTIIQVALYISSTSGVMLTHNHSHNVSPDSNLPHTIAFSIPNLTISSSEHVKACVSLGFGDGSISASICSIDFDEVMLPSASSPDVILPTQNALSTTMVVAVSAGGAIAFIGMVILFVMVTTLLMTVKSRRVGEDANRADGYGDISYAAAHTSTEFESGPVYESIIDATQMEAKACTIQADNDLVTVTCRAYGYIRRK